MSLRAHVAAVWAVLLFMMAFATAAFGQASLTIDRALESFDQPTPPASPSQHPPPASHEEPGWRLGGSLELVTGGSYLSHRAPGTQTDYKGLTSLKGLIRLALEGKLGTRWRLRASGHAWYDLAYGVRGRDRYTSQMLDAMEDEAEFDEAYVQGPLGDGLEVTLGRQILVWGRSDLFTGLTVFNPRDQREPGMYDPRDTLLPVAMARLEWARRPWNLAMIFQPENRLDKIPPFGSDFYPFNFPPPPAEGGGMNLGNAGWGFRLGRDFSGCSLALLAAYYARERDLVGLSESVTLRPLDRLWLAGLSGDAASGNFVFKLDAWLTGGLKYYQLPDETKTRADLILGLDYSGWPNTILVVEAAYRHLFDLSDDFSGRLDMPRRDTLALGLKLSRSFLREKLIAGFTGYIVGLDGSHGGAQRLSLTCKPMDRVSVVGGVIFYQRGDNYLFQHIGDNDRIFMRFVYSF